MTTKSNRTHYAPLTESELESTLLQVGSLDDDLSANALVRLQERCADRVLVFTVQALHSLSRGNPRGYRAAVRQALRLPTATVRQRAALQDMLTTTPRPFGRADAALFLRDWLNVCRAEELCERLTRQPQLN